MRARSWISVLAMLLGLPLFAASASAEPPMWVVSSPYAKVYLFGTIHILPAGFAWDSKRLDETMRKTREIWLELSDQALVRDLPGAFVHLGFDPAENLKSRLSASEIQKLAALPAAKMDGADVDGVNRMRPWFAAMAYQNRPVAHGGYVPGVDMAIMRKAHAAGTPLYGLESPAAQISALAAVPEDKALEQLHAALGGKNLNPGLVDRLAAAWAAGDMPAVEPVVTEMRDDDAAQYEKILVERNQHWASRLAPRLNGGGNALVAVGLAHLVGPDSLPNQLRKRGFSVERLDAGKQDSSASAAKPNS